MKISTSRRHFLQQVLRGFGVYAFSPLFLESLMAQILSAAYARTAGAATSASSRMYYVHISMSGGPPRWYFDLPLTPMGQTAANFKAGSFGTVLTKNAGVAGVAYESRPLTVGGKTLYLPPVWGMNLAQHKFQDLLNNTLIIRGVDMEINNHSLSNQRQVSPVIGGYSLSGMVADAAGCPLPAVLDGSTPASPAFRSKKGLSGSNLAYTESATTNPVSSLLSPFTEYRTGRVAHNADNVAMNEQVLKRVEAYAKNKGLTGSSMRRMYDAALELVDQNVIQLGNRWATTVAKYRALINEAIHPSKGSLPGLYDSLIPANTAGNTALSYALNTPTVALTDLRDLINESTALPRMAENFAAAEILLGDLTATATLQMPPLTGLQNGKGLFNMTHDQHYIGSAVSVLATTLFYRALLGCLSAFRGALVDKGLFNRTVIHIGSEFNRTPKADGSGSDHGYMGSAATIISGLIAKPAVIGNVQVASYSNTYPGTFGVAANYKLPSGETRPLRVNDVARTLSSMLGVSDVTTNGEPLVKSDNGTIWVPRNEEAKNVA